MNFSVSTLEEDLLPNYLKIEVNSSFGDIAISYQDEVKRLIDVFRKMGFSVSGVVLSFYKENLV